MRERDVFEGVPEEKTANQETGNSLEQVAFAAGRAHPRILAGANAAGWAAMDEHISFYCIFGYAFHHLERFRLIGAYVSGFFEKDDLSRGNLSSIDKSN